AAGDSGSSDGETDGQPHVDFPASSPSVLACGGTKLTARGGSIVSEVVWNETSVNEGATGGGVSGVFPLPSWQQSIAVPKAPGGGSATSPTATTAPTRRRPAGLRAPGSGAATVRRCSRRSRDSGAERHWRVSLGFESCLVRQPAAPPQRIDSDSDPDHVQRG